MGKFWRFAQQPISRRALFAGAAALVASGLAGKWLVDKFSPPDAGAGSAPQPVPPGPGFIDVREFKKTMTVEQFNQTAESYFARLTNSDFLHVKPLNHVDGAAPLLSNVSNLLRGLQLLPGMTVVDFGAGSCWLSRWLTQLGMEVIALDVSSSALKIGEALYARMPVIGKRPPPRFLHFDGRRIDLPDASVDRIVCFDTFHHLLNPDEVLGEMSRILKPGGLAGFSEPGPNHSRMPASQFEMRFFKVLEDDVDIRRIWAAAKTVGFGRMSVAAFTAQPVLFNLDQFEDFLEGGDMSQRFAAAARAQLQDQRLFFLQKGAQPPLLDSRSRTGLGAKVAVKLESATVKEGASLNARVVITNSGRATWLPRNAPTGGVSLGCHLLDASGKLLNLGFLRHPLTAGEGRAIAPGETVSLDVRIPSPPKGSYVLEFDLVSEAVGWFTLAGSEVVRVKIQVL